MTSAIQVNISSEVESFNAAFTNIERISESLPMVTLRSMKSSTLGLAQKTR